MVLTNNSKVKPRMVSKANKVSKMNSNKANSWTTKTKMEIMTMMATVFLMI